MRTVIGIVCVIVAVAGLAAAVALKFGPESPQEPPWTTALVEGKYIPLADQASPVAFPTSIPPESAIRLLVPPPPGELPSSPPPVTP